MKILIYIVLTIVPLIYLSSCEEVIEIDLNNQSPQIVIEGIINEGETQHIVKLSRSGDYFKESIFPAITGATVILSNDNGVSDTLSEIEAGVYASETIEGKPGVKYFLKVVVDGQEFTSSTTMLKSVKIDSLTYEKIEEGGFRSMNKFGYNIHCYFKDSPDVEDFNLLKLYRNGEIVDNYFLYDGKFTDGHEVDYNRFKTKFELGDEVTVDLISLERPVFEYFSTLQVAIAAISGGTGKQIMKTGTPANPNSNISNGAFGYFAAYSITRDSISLK